MKKLTAPDIAALKNVRRIACVTAYDFPTAQLADRAGMDVLLVGDSLAMVVLGHEDTLSVTMPEMLHHVRPVAAAAKRALVVGDMPFLSYQADIPTAVANAGEFLRAGARAVKVEGGGHVAHVRAMVAAGIPVMGHIGLTPQHIAVLGGFKVQGRGEAARELLLTAARELEAAGCFSLVIECVPDDVAEAVTRAVSIPTIGIGAGAHCDGQVLVAHDVLGLFERFTPRFVKRYAELAPQMEQAFVAYREEVVAGVFPGPEHGFGPCPAPAAPPYPAPSEPES